MNILAIIPARKGSKGVKNKNIRKLAGKPMIEWTIEEARKSKLITRIIVSTNDKKVMAICNMLGCEIIVRPEELATDTAPTLPVMVHAVNELEKKDGWKPEAIVLLQITAPFRTAKNIDDSLALFLEKKPDSVMSVAPVPKHYSPFWQKRIDDKGMLVPAVENTTIQDDKKYTRKQDLPTTYYKNGMIYMMWYDTLIKKNSLFGDLCLPFVVDTELQVNIDTEFDLWLAEKLWKYREKHEKLK